jgi:hypothetical protein
VPDEVQRGGPAVYARSLVAAVEKRLGPAHDRVVKRLLVNGAGGKDEPTAVNHRRRMGDVDAAGLLHEFARRRQDRPLADQQGS